jgi:chemotaxis protein MotB
MGREKKQVVEEDDGPSDEWLASYADAMTLLLAFFIMMFAFALIDEGKFFDLKVGVTAAFGLQNPATDQTSSVLDRGEGNLPQVGYNPTSPKPEEEENLEDLEDDLIASGEVTTENADDLAELLRERFDYAGAGEFVEVGVDDRGVFIRFSEALLFGSGESEVRTETQPILATAASVLGLISNPLEVEGHTDSQPTSGQFRSNWDLSVARSASVVNWLVTNGNLPDARLTAVGKSDTRPLGNNATAEGRAINRRVEIVTRVTSGFAPVLARSDEPAAGQPDEEDPGVEQPTPETGETTDGDGVQEPDGLGQPDDPASDSGDTGDSGDTDGAEQPDDIDVEINPIDDPILLVPSDP